MKSSVFNLLYRLSQKRTSICYKREVFISILMLCDDKLLQAWRPLLVLIFYNLFSKEEFIFDCEYDYDVYANTLYTKLISNTKISIDLQLDNQPTQDKESIIGINSSKKKIIDSKISIVEFEIRRKNKMISKIIDAKSNNCFVIDNKNEINGFTFFNGDILRLDVDVSSRIRPNVIDSDNNLIIISSKSRQVQLLKQMDTKFCNVNHFDTGYDNIAIKLSNKWGLFGVSSNTQICDIIQIYNFEQKFPNRIIQSYSKLQDFIFLNENDPMLISLSSHNMILWDMRTRNKCNTVFIDESESDAKNVVSLNSNKVSISHSNGKQLLYDIRYVKEEYCVIKSDAKMRYLSTAFDDNNSMLSVIYDQKIEIYNSYLENIFQKEVNLSSYKKISSSMKANLLRLL